MSFSPSLSEGAATPNSVINHDGVIENNHLNGNKPMVEHTGMVNGHAGIVVRPDGQHGQQKIAKPTPATLMHKMRPKKKVGSVANGNQEGSYKCPFCTKVFPRLGYLKKHEQVHNFVEQF